MLVNSILEGGVLAVNREGTIGCLKRMRISTIVVTSDFTVGGCKVYVNVDQQNQKQCQLRASALAGQRIICFLFFELVQ